ncbi:MAG: 2-C-methyl-D-erythritol 4-phosphate cytidylyltransferase [Rikenellaceae bacterium]
MEPRVGVVIVAGGSGLRMGGRVPKQFSFLGQKPMLAHSIDLFAKALSNVEVVVVVAEDRVDYWRNLSARFAVSDHKVVTGGAERFFSVKAGVDALSESVDVIAVHDGARPLCSAELVQRCVASAVSNGSAIPVVALADSIRERVGVEGSGGSKAVDRSQFMAVQTPQVFDAAILRRGYKQSFDASFTDDASVVERMGESVWTCDGERGNFKITTQEDMLFAQAYIAHIDSLDRDNYEQ